MAPSANLATEDISRQDYDVVDLAGLQPGKIDTSIPSTELPRHPLSAYLKSTALSHASLSSLSGEEALEVSTPGLIRSGDSTPTSSTGALTPLYSDRDPNYFSPQALPRGSLLRKESHLRHLPSTSESGEKDRGYASSLGTSAEAVTPGDTAELEPFVTIKGTPDPTATDTQSPASRDIFRHIVPVRDPILPGSSEDVIAPTGSHVSTPEDHIDDDEPQASRIKAQALAASEVASLDSAANDVQTSAWRRFKANFVALYCPTEQPALIFPTAPTDAEKVLYLQTNRLGLYTFGVFSFLSLSVGMWLFVISSPYFYWFGALVVLLQVYLIISYTVSIFGRDYDIDQHKKWVEENPIDPVTAPTVDIYLPCCKEPIEILENTYQHVQKLQWPEGKLKVYILDDGASDEVKALADKYGYNYICRDDRPRLKKAGNLRWAFARTSGDFFNIYDADFCPRPDFLYEVMPIHLALPDTAIVQTPQFFRTSVEQTWVEQGAGAVQELFYRVVQINRNRWNASICVGSNAVYRREALLEVGGTAEIGFSEDVHTGFYATDRGWKVRYLPLCLACGICPDTPRAFFSQQMRWCMGSTTLLTNMDFWRSSLGPVQKICYLSGMMYYTAISLSIFISPMPGILMVWCRPDYVKYYNLAFALPSIFYSVIAIRAWSRARFGFNAQFCMVIQSYAYLTAIKDRLFGRALAWVPSGDTKAHKNNKYRNMRILCACWMTTVVGLVAGGVAYQLLLGGFAWYDPIPLIVLDSFNLFLAHRFIFWSGKI